MPTHTILQYYQTAAGRTEGTITITDDTEVNSDLVLAPGASNILLSTTITVANLKSLLLNCTGDCTIKVNSSSAPDDTITLAANAPEMAGTASAAAALLPNTTTVTALYLSSTAGGTFSLRCILSQNTL